MSILEDEDTDPTQEAAAPEIPDAIPTPRRSTLCWTSISSARRGQGGPVCGGVQPL